MNAIADRIHEGVMVTLAPSGIRSCNRGLVDQVKPNGWLMVFLTDWTYRAVRTDEVVSVEED